MNINENKQSREKNINHIRITCSEKHGQDLGKKTSTMSELHADEKYKKMLYIFWIWVHLASFPYKSR